MVSSLHIRGDAATRFMSAVCDHLETPKHLAQIDFQNVLTRRSRGERFRMQGSGHNTFEMKCRVYSIKENHKKERIA